MSVQAEEETAVVDPSEAYPATTPDRGVSGLHFMVRMQTYFALSDHFAGRSDCFVCLGRNVYYRRHPNAAFAVPDVLVSFGVDPGVFELADSYTIWDPGAPPAFVLEIASEEAHRKGREDRLAVYWEVGASEHWSFDATGGDLHEPMLQGSRRAGGAWRPIEAAPDGRGGLRARSDALGLDLHAEPQRLRFRDPRTGLWLPDHDDTRRELDQLRREREAEAAALRARYDGHDDDAAR